MSSILIIGASSGIGQQLAGQLVRSGYQVFGTYRSNQVTSSFPNLTYHNCNVLDKQPDFSFLPEALDGLVYCPGSIILKPFHRLKPPDFQDDYQLQVIGAIKTIQTVLIAHMAEFLLTEKSGWTTGQVMHVDGGISRLKV